MIFTRILSALAAVLFLYRPAAALEPSPGENIARLKNGTSDADTMAEAVKQARATLPAFLALADNPRPGTRNFSVKIGLPTSEGKEYVWIRPFQREGRRFVGQLQNAPVSTKAIRIGERISFDQNEVADWTYLDGDLVRGNFTACAIAQMKPIAERAGFVQRYRLDCRLP